MPELVDTGLLPCSLAGREASDPKSADRLRGPARDLATAFRSGSRFDSRRLRVLALKRGPRADASSSPGHGPRCAAEEEPMGLTLFETSCHVDAVSKYAHDVTFFVGRKAA